ncbi:MAG: hypothetical protein OIF50_00325 [Flavobacteriaceae bacterium]|nr:hypothetical protein [Flavobacteriaceae bacterium]
MKQILPYIYFLFCSLALAQATESPILSNGWYQAIHSCQHPDYLYTNQIEDPVWVKINANMVVFVGLKKSEKREDNLLFLNEIIITPLLQTRIEKDQKIIYSECPIKTPKGHMHKGRSCVLVHFKSETK